MKSAKSRCREISLAGETNPKDSLSKISRRKTVQIPLKPAKKFRFARTPSPKKCQSVIRQLKTILASSNPQQRESITPIDPLVELEKPRKKVIVSKTDSRKILSHLNDPTYATTIISMLKEEPHPPCAFHQGENAAFLPRGVCLRQSQSEFDCQSATRTDVGEATDVSKTLTIRVPGPSDVINLVTGLAAGTILSSLAQSSGFYDVLAIGSKHLVESTEGHQELIGMVPKDRVSVWCYWWGYEIALPQESVERLKTVKSIETAAVQMLLALTVAGGAVELVPFIRFISGYLDMEWAAINEQNKGKGVVIAATWALPMALVPRTWDFDSPAAVAPALVKDTTNPPPAANVLAISSQ